MRKSLVSAHHGSARTRYSLFETIRAFADERLAEAGERDAARDRHAAHFGTEAAARWEQWNGPALAERGRLGADRAGEPAVGVPVERRRGHVEVATDVAAHAALMGFSVELFETIGWAESLLEDGGPGRRPAASPVVRRGGLRVLRRASRGRDGERPSGHRAGGPAGLRVVRAGLRDVHRGARTGLLRQPAIATSS